MLQVLNSQSVRSMFREGFMTSYTTFVRHRLNTTVFSQLKPE